MIPLESDCDNAERDEKAMIEAAQADPAAFELLYRRYLARVYRYLRSRLANTEDAADMTQQVFLQALDALPGYRQHEEIPFAAWLFQIARHAVTDAYRSRRNAISWDSLSEVFLPALEQDPETIVLQEERLARLRMLLSKLDADKRELLALRFAAGLSSPQIALVVGKSPAAVKKQLTRILQTLKEQYHAR